MKRKAQKHQIEIVPYENQNDVVSLRGMFLDSFTIVNSKITSLLLCNNLKAARPGL